MDSADIRRMAYALGAVLTNAPLEGDPLPGHLPL